MRTLLYAFLALAACVKVAVGAAVTVGQTQVELVINPGFNHLPQAITVSSNSAPYTGLLRVTSDSPWVTPAWNGVGLVNLSFVTSNMVASQTATIHIEAGSSTNDVFVHGTVASQLNVLKFVDDPARSRTYGVHALGSGWGSVVVVEPLTGQFIGNITVGKKPTDLAVSAATDELLVLNSVDKSITVIDLATLRVKETIVLPEYIDWDSNVTSGNLQIGAGNLIYYTDAGGGPTLYVFNRATRQLVQRLQLDSMGIGDFALTSDKRTLIGWAQWGWNAGWAGSYIIRFSVDTNGIVTQRETTDTQYPTSIMRDPLDTPVLIPNDDSVAFVKQKVVGTGNLSLALQSFPYPVYAISPGGEIAVTSEGIYERATGNRIFSLTGSPTASVVTSDYARLVYFDVFAAQIKFLDLLEAVGNAVLGRTLSPADKAVILSPSKLTWSPIPGVGSYRVYLGETRAEVANATTNSPQYLGATAASEFPLSGTFTSGRTYYWRVDSVSANGVVAGAVYEFTVSTIGASVSLIQGSTLQGYKSVIGSFDVTGATAGTPWVAIGGESWISFKTNSGVTPATVEVIVDASKLGVALVNSTVLIGRDTNSLVAVPLRVRVEPLSLTILKSDPTSAFVYGISENTQDQIPHAYLVEIDTANELITRIEDVGSSVTDLAIHNAEGRIYVPNWNVGLLRAINKSTFALDRMFTFAPFAGVGYGQGDVFRIAPGVRGRLIVEEMDQWINISMLNTDTGATQEGPFVREGGGVSDPTGNYYYHGENNSSGASIQKYAITNYSFTQVAAIRVASASYYGSRVVTISEDGSRIFWNGSALNTNLVEEWAIGQFIYSSTPNGRYAFAESLVYDVDLRKVAFGMPVNTKVSAYNSASSKLVVQRNGRVEFYPFSQATPLVKPVLFTTNFNSTSVTLNWRDLSLETEFTVQWKRADATQWMDAPVAPQNITQSYISGLTPETRYQFRVKATSPVASSEWSDVVEVTTPGMAPTQIASIFQTVTSSLVTLNWTDAQYENGYLLERSTNGVAWLTLGTLASNVTTFSDSSVFAGANYTYRLRATNVWGFTEHEVTVSVPAPAPPQIPSLTSLRLLSGLGVAVRWNAVLDATSYEIERRVDNPATWVKIATVTTPGLYEDRNIEAQREYSYRVIAVNSVGRSNPSQSLTILADFVGCIVADDFENGIAPGAWESTSNGEVIGDTPGLLHGKALWFGGSGTRSATTLPANVRTGTTLRFGFRAGNSESTNRWDVSELGESVVVEYSTNATTWTTLTTYNTSLSTFFGWNSLTLALPSATFSTRTQFRWRQLRHSGAANDTWALDDVCLEGPLPPLPTAPPFVVATPSSSHAMAIWWVGSVDAREYVVERASGTNGWMRLAATGGGQTWFTDTACLPSTTYAYRVKASNTIGFSPYSAVVFGTTISQIAEWQVTNLGSTSMAITAPGSDGVPMLLRFAFNMDASAPVVALDLENPVSGAPVVELNEAAGNLEILFLRRKAQSNPGIAYDVEFSDDLKKWVGTGSSVAVRSIDETWELARFADSAGWKPLRFGRVTVRLQEQTSP